MNCSARAARACRGEIVVAKPKRLCGPMRRTALQWFGSVRLAECGHAERDRDERALRTDMPAPPQRHACRHRRSGSTIPTAYRSSLALGAGCSPASGSVASTPASANPLLIHASRPFDVRVVCDRQESAEQVALRTGLRSPQRRAADRRDSARASWQRCTATTARRGVVFDQRLLSILAIGPCRWRVREFAAHLTRYASAPAPRFSCRHLQEGSIRGRAC